MHADVTEFRDFYHTPLGLVVRRALSQKVRALWPRPAGCTLAGYGFATPFIGSFRGEASRLGAFMPTCQGALVWPSADRNMTVLVEEDFLPLPDDSVERMLMVHGLEFAERPTMLLREVWRVLAPEGRLIVIVPNRTGLWARTDRTPFGQGQPYSSQQIDVIMRDAMLTPLRWDSALYMPPVGRAMALKAAPTLERLGRHLTRHIAGVTIVEAAKEMVAPIGIRARSQGRLRVELPVVVPVPAPGGAGMGRAAARR